MYIFKSIDKLRNGRYFVRVELMNCGILDGIPGSTLFENDRETSKEEAEQLASHYESIIARNYIS